MAKPDSSQSNAKLRAAMATLNAYCDTLRTKNEVLEAEAEKWKRIAQDRCTCAQACGDTPEESGGVCKELPRG